MRRGSGNAPQIKYVGHGGGGIDEMATSLDDSKVMFGMLRFVFGSGSFARVKYVFVHMNGDNCSAVKRGRYNALKGEAEEAFGSFHTEALFTTVEECTMDRVLEILYKNVVSDDNIDGSFSIGQMKKDLQAQVEAARRELEASSSSKTVAAPIITASDMVRTIKWSEALQMVRADLGPFNWMLVTADPTYPELHNAGAGSVKEMVRYLGEGQVLYGLIRMGFGTGQFRRSKWLFLHWSGEKVSAVQRGKLNAVEGDMKLLLGAVNIEISATSKEELSLEEVLARVHKAVVTDGEATESKETYSMDKFLEALKEETAELQKEFGSEMKSPSRRASSVDSPSSGGPPGLDSSVKLVRSDSEPYNWVLAEVL